MRGWLLVLALVALAVAKKALLVTPDGGNSASGRFYNDTIVATGMQTVFITASALEAAVGGSPNYFTNNQFDIVIYPCGWFAYAPILGGSATLAALKSTPLPVIMTDLNLAQTIVGLGIANTPTPPTSTQVKLWCQADTANGIVAPSQSGTDDAPCPSILSASGSLSVFGTALGWNDLDVINYLGVNITFKPPFYKSINPGLVPNVDAIFRLSTPTGYISQYFCSHWYTLVTGSLDTQVDPAQAPLSGPRMVLSTASDAPGHTETKNGFVPNSNTTKIFTATIDWAYQRVSATIVSVLPSASVILPSGPVGSTLAADQTRSLSVVVRLTDGAYGTPSLRAGRVLLRVFQDVPSQTPSGAGGDRTATRLFQFSPEPTMTTDAASGMATFTVSIPSLVSDYSSGRQNFFMRAYCLDSPCNYDNGTVKFGIFGPPNLAISFVETTAGPQAGREGKFQLTNTPDSGVANNGDLLITCEILAPVYRVVFGSPVSPALSTTKVSGLTPETTYTFRVNQTSQFGTTSSTFDGSTTNGSPNPPVNFVVSQRGDAFLTMKWDAPANNGDAIRQYQIYRGTTIDQNFATDGAFTCNVTATTFTDSGLQPSMNYNYKVLAVNSFGPSPTSYLLNQTTGSVPTPPSMITCVNTATTLDFNTRISWSGANANGAPIDLFELLITGSLSGPLVSLFNTSASSYTNNKVTHDSTYYYAVRAHNSFGWGPLSSLESCPTTAAVPDAVQPRFDNATSSTVSISWDTPSGNGAAVTNYTINMNAATGSLLTPFSPQVGLFNSFVFTGLPPSFGIQIFITASNAIGTSVSAELDATSGPPDDCGVYTACGDCTKYTATCNFCGGKCTSLATNNCGSGGTVCSSEIQTPALSPPAIIGAAAGGGVGLICIIIVIVCLIRRARGRKLGKNDVLIVRKTMSTDEKMLRTLIFGDWLDLLAENQWAGQMEADAFLPLVNVLIQPGFTFALAMCAVTDMAKSLNIARALVYFYDRQNCTVGVLQSLITEEVASTIEANTLFRTNSMATKCFQQYAMLRGLTMLRNTLWDVIQETILEVQQQGGDPSQVITNKNAEIDASKMGEDEDSNANKFYLMFTCQKIMTAIYKCAPTCPLVLKQVLSHVYTTVHKKFPDAAYQSVGAFFFLRFVCPAITNPEQYGLCDGVPLPFQQRHLVLVGKTIISLANENTLGTKEAFMTQVKQFIDDNKEKLHQFYLNLVYIPPDAASTIDSAGQSRIPEPVYINSLACIHSHGAKRADAIKTDLNKRGASTGQDMTSLIGEISKAISATNGGGRSASASTSAPNQA